MGPVCSLLAQILASKARPASPRWLVCYSKVWDSLIDKRREGREINVLSPTCQMLPLILATPLKVDFSISFGDESQTLMYWRDKLPKAPQWVSTKAGFQSPSDPMSSVPSMTTHCLPHPHPGHLPYAHIQDPRVQLFPILTQNDLWDATPQLICHKR